MISKVWQWLMAGFILLSPLAYAQGINAQYVKNNPDGSQTLLNHVPKEVASGLAAKVGHADSNQNLDLRVILPSKDQAGLDNFLKELYDPKSPNYHKFLTPAQFDLLYGASSTDSAIVSNYLKSQGLFVRKYSKNGIILYVSAQVSTVEPAFNLHINNYKRMDGTTFFAPDADPTIPPQVAGKINAIMGMENAIRFHPHYHLTKILTLKKALNPVSTNPPATTVVPPVSSTVMISGFLHVNINSRSGGPAAPAGLTATASDGSVVLYWQTSATATSYNVARSTTNGGSYTTIATGITADTYTDDGSGNSNDTTPNNGSTYYYVVSATNGGGTSANSNQASVTPFAFLGFGGSVGPTDIADAYNLNSVSSTGSGQTLGLFELDGYNSSDINGTGSLPPGCNGGSIPCYQSFEANYGLPNVPLTNVYTDGFSGTPGAGTDEVVLDIDMAVAVAPGLSNILVYEAPNNSISWLDQWDNLADPPGGFPSTPNVISCSWGDDEAASTDSASVHTELAELAAEGVTILVSAGDSGAYDNCDGGTLSTSCTSNGTPTTPELSVDYPASDPYVTGVGISILQVGNNAGVSNGSYNNEEASLFGGGGVSSLWSIPSYQVSAATNFYNSTSGAFGSTTSRNVPDVVLNADPASFYGIYVTDPDDPDSANSAWYAIWGSSAAAPIWAAFVSRVNQGRVAAGESIIGFLNPTIYQVAQNGTNYANDFHDITTGINDSYANFSGNQYYPAKAGYDPATGLGSFNGANLYSDLVNGPAAPTGLTPTAGNTQVSLSWTAVTGAVSYNVKRSTTSGGPYTTVSTSGSVTTTNYTDTSLSNGQTYYYVVSTVNNLGVEGANSSQVSATPIPAPAAPTGLNATPGNAQVSLTWTASSGAVSYNVKRSTTSGSGYVTVSTSGLVTTTNYTDTLLTNGQIYYYVVSAVGAGGEGANSSQASATPVGPPPAPTGLNATPGNAQVSLTWTASSGAVSYNVKRSTTNGSGYVTISTSGSVTTTNYTDTLLTNGQIYYYVVSAVDGQGEGPNSSQASATPVAPPAAPTGLNATPGNAQVSLTWTASSGAVSYNVKRSTTNGSGYVTVSTSGSVTTTNYTDTLLTNGQAYYYVVSAVNAGGESPNSSQASATPVGPPPAPTGLNATPGNAQVSLTWTASSGAISYNVKRSTTNGSGYVTVSTSGSVTTTNYTDTLLTNGQIYYYVVSAVGAGGEGANSSQASATPAGPPSTPTIVTAVAGNTQATVSFSGASANGSVIDLYTVTAYTGGVTTGITNTGVSSPVTITGLTNGTSYTFEVTASNGVGTSSSSVASNSVTPNVVPGAPTGVSAVAGNTQATVSFSAPAPNGGTSIISYTVTSSPGNISNTGASSPITVTGLINGQSYTFTVTASNAAGPGPASAASSGVVPAGPPTAPTTVTASAGDMQATVSFSGASANGSPITGYTVTPSPPDVAPVPGVSSPITVTGLTNGTSYTFTVTSSNMLGTSGASAASNSVTPSPVAPPTALSEKVLGLRMQGQIIYTGVSLSWQQSTNPSIVQNKIYRSTNSGSYSLLATVRASTAYTDTSAVNGKNYAYEVTALNSNSSESVPSNIVAVNY